MSVSDICVCFLILLNVMLRIHPVTTQRFTNVAATEVQLLVSELLEKTAFGRPRDDGRCHCMEYWECVTSGGKPVSYCGPSENQVCCFIAKNARPVGILPSPSTKRSQCGKKGSGTASTTNNLIDGTSEFGEWPWQAAILEKNGDLYVCGATLIDERWLLTAAHCVNAYSENGTPLKVRLGEHNVTTTEEKQKYEEVDVDRVIRHPNFINTTLLNDIALLHLNKRVAKRLNIDIVCLPTVDVDDKISHQQQCVITGWGRTAETTEHSKVLKEIPVPLWNNSACETALKIQFGPSFAIPQTAICAGAEHKDACDGDGGGPLVCERNGRWEQVGIVSYGIGCGLPNLPGVYTRVLVYSSWIKQTIRANT